jgi:hypothetical protein
MRITMQELRSVNQEMAVNAMKAQAQQHIDDTLEDLQEATLELAYALLSILREAAPHDYNTYRLAAIYESHDGFTLEDATYFAEDVRDALRLAKGH